MCVQNGNFCTQLIISEYKSNHLCGWKASSKEDCWPSRHDQLYEVPGLFRVGGNIEKTTLSLENRLITEASASPVIVMTIC